MLNLGIGQDLLTSYSWHCEASHGIIWASCSFAGIRAKEHKEVIIILLHLPHVKLPAGAHKQANPQRSPLLADGAAGIKKEQIMESKKRL